MPTNPKYNLEARLTAFAVKIVKLVDQLHNTKAGNALGNQIVRSGTSPALNYGEAQSAESKKDFVHKFKIVLKELRETYICLQIIDGAEICENSEFLKSFIVECNEMIAIFVKSILTAEKKEKE
jgi:four helix bundle protein